MIPTAAKVPHYLKLRNGTLERKVREEFQWYHDEAMKLSSAIFQHLGMWDYLEKHAAIQGKAVEKLSEEQVVEFKIVDGLRLVGHGLGMNYRVNAEILCALDVFDEDNATKAFACVIDMPEIIDTRSQKKNLEYAILRVT